MLLPREVCKKLARLFTTAWRCELQRRMSHHFDANLSLELDQALAAEELLRDQKS